MIQLSEVYKKNGYKWIKVNRIGNVAIYKNSESDHFEVFIVKQIPDCILFGKEQPAHETVPSNEEWGTNGFTYMDFKFAASKFMQLVEESKNVKNG